MTGKSYNPIDSVVATNFWVGLAIVLFTVAVFFSYLEYQETPDVVTIIGKLFKKEKYLRSFAVVIGTYLLVFLFFGFLSWLFS